MVILTSIGIFCVLFLVPCLGKEPSKPVFNHIETLVGKKAIEDFKKEPHVRVIYYYKQEFKNRFKIFLKELDKSVEFLDLYNVKIRMVDCTSTENFNVVECKKAKSERSVFTYRSGSSLLQLELETMFDVNSIMSNLLQLVLLREVPIFQTKQEVESFLGRQKGKQDVIFGYMKAIGTFDHRVFMEVAYAYSTKVKFAICTDRIATKVFEEPVPSSDASTLWWVWTKDMKQGDKHFQSLQYKGPFNLAELARYVKYVTQHSVFHIPEDGMAHNVDGGDVALLTFYYKTDRQTEMYNLAEIISKHFVSVLRVVTINIGWLEKPSFSFVHVESLPLQLSYDESFVDLWREDNEVQKEYKCTKRLPAVSLTRKGQDSEEFYSGDLHLELLFRFIEQRVEVANRIEVTTDDEDEHGPDDEGEASHDDYIQGLDIEAVERQDDKVAYSVSQTKNVPMLLDLVPALTDKSFNKTVKAGPIAVILFYFPFTAVNSVNLRYFGEATDRLGDQTKLKIGRVNCYDWTDVCQDQNIVHYPTLRVYKNRAMAWDYKGPQDPQEMYSMMKILELSSPLYLDDPVEVMTFMVGQGQKHLKHITNTTVVGLFNDKSSKEMEMFKKIGEESREKIIYVYTNKDADKIAQQFGRTVPCIILSKFDDRIEPIHIFDEKYTSETIHNFIQQNKLPKLTELSPLMFPELRKQGDSMVILFTDETHESTLAKDELREVVKTKMFSNVTFTTFHSTDESSVAYKVLMIYSNAADFPYLSFVNFDKGEVYNFGPPRQERQGLINWLGSVLKGTEQPSVQLSNPDWQPMNKGYEFLKIIDYENEQKAKSKGRVRKERNEESHDLIEHPDEVVEEEMPESVMEDTMDADTRRDLFNSRLYHQAPGRMDKQKTSHSHHDEL